MGVIPSKWADARLAPPVLLSHTCVRATGRMLAKSYITGSTWPLQARPGSLRGLQRNGRWTLDLSGRTGLFVR